MGRQVKHGSQELGYMELPRRSSSPCRYPGCGNLIPLPGYCDNHKKAVVGWDHTKTTTQRGYGQSWRKLRKIILERDSYLCQQCKRRGTVRAATEVDHIIPKFKGGDDDHDNLEAICKQCHASKTAKEKR